MTEKDEHKKPERSAQKKRNRRNSVNAGGDKHPDQNRAEQEEEKTRREAEAGAAEPLDRKAIDASGKQPSEGEPGELSKSAGSAPEDAKEPAFPIVGIGASAGGLEALESFFSALPLETGMAFVVITHTDPKHQSLLPDLIRKKARIPVRLLEDGMPARPNTVFLPPSDMDAILIEGIFRLRQRPSQSELHMPVDLFLKHLAEDRGRFGACIILSGTGTDGTQGLRLIKEQAGLSMVQSPDSARHSGMPRSALDTGLVDYVLSPAEMPEQLARYFQHPAAISHKSREREEKEPDPLRRILAFLANRTRQDFSLYKENTLIRRIERRMTITNSRDASAYIQLLHQNPEEVRLLFQDLLIGVTSFFRDPESFAFLRREVLPDLVSRSPSNALRVWVPGCATGEEAYSLAILLKESLEESEVIRELQIFGTDIDPKAIEKARQGIYVQNIAADVNSERLKRFFTGEDSRYRLKPEIRERVVFALQNVLEDPPFSDLDLLVCRNLLIYLKPEAQNRLIPLFHYALKKDGVLFLGNSESVGRHQDLFAPVSKPYNVYRKKDGTVRPQVRFPTGARKLVRPPEPSKSDTELDQRDTNVGPAAEKMLMEEHTPACVVVNEKGEILHFHGRTGKYLEPASGEPTLQVADMAREGLRFAVLAGMRRCREKNAEVREQGVWVKTNGEHLRINLIVKPLSVHPFKNTQMIVFEEQPEKPEPHRAEASTWTAEEDAGRVDELEQELMRLREDYRSAMEELQASNEELRSSNEELQSTNEELESSREELQSLNEELNTVNSELNSKMAELREAYNAINAVLDNTRIAIVFLDTDLQVTRFTPEATQLLNLIESDVGRPIDHIAHNLEHNHLVKRVRDVLKTLTPVDEEVRCRDGSWYRMRIMVYRPQKPVIEGVVLTFINIDAQKEAQEELREISDRAVTSARRFAESIVDTVRESLLVLDEKMRVVTANRSFYQTFHIDPEAAKGTSLFALEGGLWDIPTLKILLQEILEKKKSFEDFRMEHRFPKVGFKRLLLNARMLRDGESREARILLAMQDATKAETVQEETS